MELSSLAVKQVMPLACTAYSTHSLGVRRTWRSSSSLVPFSGACMYSQRASRGRDIKMLSIRAPGVYNPNLVPRSYTRLNSTYLWTKRKIKGTKSSITHFEKIKGQVFQICQWCFLMDAPSWMLPQNILLVLNHIYFSVERDPMIMRFLAHEHRAKTLVRLKITKANLPIQSQMHFLFN